jgi:arylsulfatase A-like enzyme
MVALAAGACVGLVARVAARAISLAIPRIPVAWSQVALIFAWGLWLLMQQRIHDVPLPYGSWIRASVLAGVAVAVLLVAALMAWGLRQVGAVRGLRYAVAAAFAAALAVWMLLSPATPGGDDDGRPNVLLISMDTTRADHLEPFGYERATSPFLAELARDGVLFEEAFANEPWTLPSHITMLTGLHPLAHGVRMHSGRLHPDATTLAETLRESGYRTMALVAGPPESPIGGPHGFDRGFELYHHPPHHRLRSLGAGLFDVIQRIAGPTERTAPAIVDAALGLLDAPRRQPFFLFLHFFDVHSDHRRDAYDAPEALIETVTGGHPKHRDSCDEDGLCATHWLLSFGQCDRHRHREMDATLKDDIVRHYDAGIRFLDDALGRLFDGLVARGRDEDTLIIVTADHGEAFGEHGRFLHDQIYNSLLHVPLLLRFPGSANAGTRVATPVQLIDLVPTVLDAVGLEPHPDLPGRSLLPLLDGESEPVDLFFSNSNHDTGRRTLEISILSGGRKLILPLSDFCGGELVHPQPEIYDIGADFDERNDLIGEVDRQTVDSLLGSLRAWQDRSLAYAAEHGAEGARGMDLDPRTLDYLKALGYLEADRESAGDR